MERYEVARSCEGWSRDDKVLRLGWAAQNNAQSPDKCFPVVEGPKNDGFGG